MKVLFCASEVVPFAKTGGLADVSGTLPKALEKLGCQIKIVLPKYRGLQADTTAQTLAECRVNLTRVGKSIDVYLIENDGYFDRKGLYGDEQGDYPDNLERFVFFCKQSLNLLRKIDFSPQIIHCNDWQTALIVVYLQTLFKDDPFFRNTRSILTVHNLAYQGVFAKEQFPKTGLEWNLFNIDGFEFYGKINLLKAGILFSHLNTTVSPTYAREIQTARFGCGLEGVLRKRKKDLFGIINGVDYSVWNPAEDNKIFQRYNSQHIEAKYTNKEKLQKECNLVCNKDIPMVGIVNRLAEQKGVELIISAMDQLANLDLQFVLLGTGERRYHNLLEKIKNKRYANISISLRFDPVLAHKIYAGCDMFLIPSNYEPCGLGQLISFKYGTIPIVRKTGGLADTVVDYRRSGKGNGFVFEQYSTRPMLKAIKRALDLYKQKEKWRRLILKVMDYDFSWASSAERYLKLYQDLVNEN